MSYQASEAVSKINQILGFDIECDPSYKAQFDAFISKIENAKTLQPHFPRLVESIVFHSPYFIAMLKPDPLFDRFILELRAYVETGENEYETIYTTFEPRT